VPETRRPDGPIGPSQFGVERNAGRGPARRAVSDRADVVAGTQVTFAQMMQRSCAAANALTAMGVGRGDSVALFTATCPEWVYFWLGAARIGAVTAAVNAANKDEFLVHALRLARAKVVITDAERHPRLREVADRVQTVESVLVVGDSLSDVLADASSGPPDTAPAEPGELAALFFTSGTTGPSKAVATSWHYLFSAAAAVAACWEIDAGDVLWTAMPLFHLSAAPSVLAPMLVGGTTVLSATFRPRASCFSRRIRASSRRCSLDSTRK
jgi:crotonobetaine/carnitine-CoA ligase